MVPLASKVVGHTLSRSIHKLLIAMYPRYNIPKFASTLMCRRRDVSYVSFYRRFFVSACDSSDIVETNARVNKELSRTREPVMRINQGSLELSDTPVCDVLDEKLQFRMESSAPEIDKNTFKNYIEVPQQGIRSFFGETKTVRVLLNDIIPFKQYVPGTQSSHHYPLGLLPRKLSMKLGGDIFVTSFSIHEKDYKVENGKKVMLSAIHTLNVQPHEPLLQKLYGKITILIVFSGEMPHSDAKGALEWKEVIDFGVDTLILLNSPCPIGMSYFHKRYLNSLAYTLVERNAFSCLTRKLKEEEKIAFHQYRKQFASLLLVDKYGYIRWHAVGKPSREAIYLLKEAYEHLSLEV